VKTGIVVTVEVDIDRPASAVWSFLADVERMPEWLGEFEAATKESDDPMGVGTVIRYTIRPGHRSGTFELVEWDPPRRVAWDGPALRLAGGGTRPRGSHTLDPLGHDRTRLVSRYEPELTGTNVLLRPYLARWLRRQRSVDAQALKAAVEADAA
jgi:uncharacterized protein YndB with AHSA1/START domain